MKTREEIINNYYKEVCYEDDRLDSVAGKIEFITTTKYVEKYLKKDGRILEVGAGTGRYSLYYANMGYEVNSIEYVQSNLDILKSKVKKNMNITPERGDALDLSRFEDNTFDVTLVLGPLYHLYDKKDQLKAISEALRVTKKGGMLAIAYLTSDSVMIDWALKDNHLIDGYKKDFDENFKMINYPEGVFAAFYISEFKELMSNFDITFESNVATDGVSRHFKDKLSELTEEEYEMWIKYHLSTCEREDLQGYSSHMLYLCKKN